MGDAGEDHALRVPVSAETQREAGQRTVAVELVFRQEADRVLGRVVSRIEADDVGRGVGRIRVGCGQRAPD